MNLQRITMSGKSQFQKGNTMWLHVYSIIEMTELQKVRIG